MCDDFEPDVSDDDQADEFEEDAQTLDELLADLARELFGDVPPRVDDEDERSEDAPATPGEHLRYALGQLHRLHLAGRLPVHPNELVRSLAPLLPSRVRQQRWCA